MMKLLQNRDILITKMIQVVHFRSQWTILDVGSRSGMPERDRSGETAVMMWWLPHQA
jgi:hypothetical protein